jgi:hypothetical protein
VFDDDWFGRVDSTEHTMTKGRWAYTEVKKGDSDAGDVRARHIEALACTCSPPP